MKDAQPRTIYLKDYQAPDYWIDTTHLTFDLYEDHALVTSVLQMRLNDDTNRGEALPALVLHGEELDLVSLVSGRRGAGKRPVSAGKKVS